MEHTFYAYGHPNVTSRHRSTFEVTSDSQIGKTADCIIGVSSEADMDDIPLKIKEALKNENQIVKMILKTENSQDEIYGYGHPLLTLDHPTDMVCRTSDHTCSRTLMIRANKAACDLKKELIEDIRKGKALKIKIIVE
ncbi:MAG: DUF371 domain-containing protein [Methanobacteriaceae archaeon]|nr:DUF371 domain-containing protein [Methanobacteriaceae archaeon]